MSRVLNVRNRKRVTDPRAKRLIKESLEVATNLGYKLPEDLSFYTCKASRRAGLACYNPPVIVLSEFLFKETDDHAKTTILHEIAHIIAGPGVHHGPAWQKIVSRMNNATGYKISRTWSTDDMPIQAAALQKSYKYVFRCQCCGKEIRRMRASEFTRTYNEKLYSGKPRWTCAYCGGAFKKVSNN